MSPYTRPHRFNEFQFLQRECCFSSPSLHPFSSVFTVNIPLNIHSLDISSFKGEDFDLGGDDCEEAESNCLSPLHSLCPILQILEMLI